MSKIWFTSDTHFGHGNIIKYCLRGYGSRAERLAEFASYDSNFDEMQQKSKLLFADPDEMNRVMIERWNSVVAPEDTVYHLGDFAMGNLKYVASYVEALNGRIRLVKGNHDCDSKWNVKKEVRDAGFESINDQLFVEVDGYKLWLAHIPMSTAPDKRNYERPDPTEDYDIALCGHVHDKFVVNDFGNINVGCDNFEFTPRSLSEILDAAEAAPIFDSSIFLPV